MRKESIVSDANDLTTVPLFHGLEQAHLDELMAKRQVRKFPRQATVINEGDATDALYLVNSGRVKVVRTQENGKEVVMAVLGPGDHFGEMSLIDNEPRSASVVTKEASEFTILRRLDFEAVLLKNPQLTINIMRGLSSRLRDADQNIESLALMDVYGRIARLLLQLGKEEGDKVVIREELTHQDIASMVGSSREMVSRILKDLSRGGYITVEKKIITVNTKLPAAW